VARILSKGVWFDQVAPASLYETEFEAVVLQNASLLFPHHILIPFKVLLYAENESAIADMALVEERCREWWLVEVEMVHHSLDSHVLPQVRTLSRCSCGPAEAQELARQCPQLQPSSILDMVKGKAPRVLVLLNTSAPEWILPLRRYDAEIAVVEIFRSGMNQRLFRVNGFSPSPPPSAFSECALDPILPGFLQVESPAALKLPTKDRVAIEYEGGVSYWERVDSMDRVWLTPMGANPLKANEKYNLVRRVDGSYQILTKAAATGRGFR
jgi:hypothetical protein